MTPSADGTPKIQFQPRPKPGAVTKFADDDEEFLFGPTTRPDEPVTSGAVARFAPAPKTLGSVVDKLLLAAAQPDAPPELHAFIRLLRIHQGV
jgi:hypothetical protein